MQLHEYLYRVAVDRNATDAKSMSKLFGINRTRLDLLVSRGTLKFGDAVTISVNANIPYEDLAQFMVFKQDDMDDIDVDEDVDMDDMNDKSDESHDYFE